MAVIDPELERHRHTWLGFVRLIKFSIVAIVIVLGLLAMFVV